ncbi:MAG: D-inositol-3-phosphate glycosyltransferase [Anaerolineae bacterium]|nr:D-inositol-3-phosphate glycosyltransferase [Anaerolineae bacterium]
MKLVYVAYSALDLQSANSLQTFNTLRELSKRLGERLQIIVPRFGAEAPPPFPATRLARIPVNKLSRIRPNAWYSYIERTLYARRAIAKIRAGAAALIYTRDSVCAYRFIQAGLPVLYEAHDLESRHPGQTKSARLQAWVRRADETILRGARGIVSLTETFRQEIIANDWQPAERVFVIPDAYDDAVYFPRDQISARRALHLQVDAPLVAYAGLTFKYRGLDVLLRAFQAWNETRAQLLLIGGRAFEIQELQTLARALKLGDCVQWIGRQPPDVIAAYLAAADALVIPDTVTDATASPLKMFEYMAMRRPIVCVDRAALREILDDAALYFPRGNVEDLAAQLARAVQPAAQSLGVRARERVQEFTYAKRAEKIARAAESVLNA